MDKKQVRGLALVKRDGLTEEQRKDGSGKILNTLMGLSDYRRAEALLTYVSFRSEVSTVPLIRAALAEKKAVFAPKVMGRDMEFFRIFAWDDLQPGYQGILEPAGNISYDDYVSQFRKKQEKDDGCSDLPRTLVCIPGAAFDRDRHRIGYGGGFYDRYLSKMAKKRMGTVPTAALAFDCQIFGEIPWETYDIRPACIVTESEIIL